MFALQATQPLTDQLPPFLNGSELLFVNARSAIATLVWLLTPTRVWVPAYLCDALLRAVSRPGVQVRFYAVDCQLAPAACNWLDEVQPHDLVVLIDYFGFHHARSWAAAARARGARVLEDACQALLSPGVGDSADFIVFSPRKFLGVPDGGILRLNRPLAIEEPSLKAPPPEWWLGTLSASLSRREFDLTGGERGWFELFQKSESDAPLGPYAMSEMSRLLLLHSFDYPAIARQRVQNYRHLSERLRDLALFPELADDVVPLGFPICVNERDRVRHGLFRHHIYPPVHWHLKGIVPVEYRESHRLADDILTLPCDQRYDSSDMERMAALVRSEVGR